ncbi:hypothetical protein RUM44_008487 [Polyplax serrata]|uniref:Ribosomal RNA-processing protein 40 n=1 Tax=Polyplax serrata TaxID=468196 RepID=A0ABR1BCF2_POLSC
MEPRVNSVVVPGDVILSLSSEIKNKIIVGPGLRVSSDKIIATKCGVLHKKGPNVYWVDSRQKRYIPARGETVVGVVTSKAGDIYKVDIGSSEQAQLPYLAFEGATKKIRPLVNVGDVVYAKLLIANRDLEPELVCVDSHGKKGKLGILSSEGFMFNCSLNLVRKILNPKCPLIDTFQRVMDMPFEIAAGMNGNIWVRAKSVQETIAIANAILAVEYKTDDEINDLCQNIGNILAGF